MLQSTLLALLLSIAGLVLAIISAPNGLLYALLVALLARFQRRIPAAQYAVLQQLAVDVVTGVHQMAAANGWDSAAKRSAAVAILQETASAHGINRFGQQVLGVVVEKAWADVKPTLPAAVVAPIEATIEATISYARNDRVTLADAPAPAVAATPAPVAATVAATAVPAAA